VNRFEVARRALGDLETVWEFVSNDSFDAADRLLEDFYGSAILRKCRDWVTDARISHRAMFSSGRFTPTS
jgi:hypothetical protein